MGAMPDTVDAIKEKLSIVDVVQPYVKLTRAGKYWKGLSPFTKEKTPSFFVSPDKGLYHCFSTGKGGDMFTFIQEMEGVDFKGSLQLLADKAGVEIQRSQPSERDERDKIYAALEAATQFYVETLSKRSDVLEYLARRGIDHEFARRWHVGYAPKDWNATRDALLAKGFSQGIIAAAGLVKQSEREENSAPRFYDRFRGRVMFPIRDVAGRVVGFSGRIFEDDPTHPQAKYINSPDGPLFDKSRALYGIHEARQGIRDLGASLLVEGQVDLLLAQKIGYKNTVATSGTAFTEHHASILKRYAENCIIAYDGDEAGVRAAGRAALLLLSRGMNVKVAAVPKGSDPAELILTDPAHFKAAIKSAVHVIDFYIAYLRGMGKDERWFKLEASKTVLPFISVLPNAIDREHFIKHVADELMVSDDAVRAELAKLGSTQSIESDGPKQDTPHALARSRLAQGLLLILNATQDPRGERLRQLLGEVETEDDETKLQFEAEVFIGESGNSFDTVVHDVIVSLERDLSRREYEDAAEALRRAERDKDVVAIDQAMARLTELAKQAKH